MAGAPYGAFARGVLNRLQNCGSFDANAETGLCRVDPEDSGGSAGVMLTTKK